MAFSNLHVTGLFEDGQEYQYSYQAYTITGVREPTLFSSSFGIRGNLIIQKQPGIATLKVMQTTKFSLPTLVIICWVIVIGSDLGYA